MVLYILACLIGLIPLIALFLWLRSYVKRDEEYRKLCNKFLQRGILCIFPVILFSAVCHILIRLTGVQNSNPLLYEALHTFIVLAWFFHGLYDFSLSEELHAINDNLVIIPLLLAVMDIVLVIIQIVFTVKAKKRKEYTEPL